jgi:pantothenate kinase
MMQIATAEDLLARLAALPAKRQLVAVAGPPASGKSTLAAQLAEALCEGQPDRAVVVPMDGYHFDDVLLDMRGHRTRKGAPHTFDVGGLRHMLGRLKTNSEEEVAIPLFDREIETSRAGAAVVASTVEIILVEGNYLLLDQAPWDSLHAFFDLTVMIDVPEAELRRRLGQRWVAHGLDAAAIAAKIDANDMPNGLLVKTASRAADLVVQNC